LTLLTPADNARFSRKSQVEISGITLNYLTSGDSFLFNSSTVLFASWKTPLAGREKFPTPLAPTTDIFSSATDINGTVLNPNEFNVITCNLVNSQVHHTVGYSYEQNPQILVKLDGGVGYEGMYQGTDYVSFSGMSLEISTV